MIQLKDIKYWSVLVLIIYFSMVVYSSSCQPLNHQLSKCRSYINDGDVYYNSNQSSHLAAALNATVAVIGSYCRDRAMELLCNYFFPQCVNDNIVPICNSSCSEYLHTGICAGHIITLLNELNSENYSNVSVERLLRDCSPPYNLSISEDCVNLTDVPSADNHVQCAPVQPNVTCSPIGSYAIDIAQLEVNIAIINNFEHVKSTVLDSDIDPVCIALLDALICIYKFPLCLDFKLVVPCATACGKVFDHLGTCASILLIAKFDNQTLNDHFARFDCDSPESYYIGYDEGYFLPMDMHCMDLPPEISLMTMPPTTYVGIDINGTDDSSGNTDTKNVNPGIIIGAVLSTCVVILIVVVSLLIICTKRKRNLRYHNHMVASDQISTRPTIGASSMLPEFKKAFAGEIINPNNLKIEEELGKGAFGKVYKGVYTNQTEILEVAIKTLQFVDDSNVDQFIQECIIAKRFNHPNILNLIGVSYKEGEAVPLMILPFMHNGDIKSFVKSKRGNILEVIEYPEGLNYNILAKMCLDIAKGMEYLSSLRCVHRDLAARNCMLDENMIAKVADFGLSRDVYLTDYYKIIGHNTPLPVKWLALEALIDRKFTTQSDVWSFGVTCWEIFTLGLEPYPSVDEGDMVNYLNSKTILDKPFLSSGKMYEIMKSCWKFEPEDRPTFSLIVEQLNQQHP